MATLSKIGSVLTRYVAVIIIALSVWAFFAPGMFSWATNYTTVFLGIIMFGMGLTIKASDFRVVFTHPKEVVLGAVCQYTIMPLAAFALATALHLPADIALGVILVGCCPGGVSSNIMSYLCHGDVAFSVGMTTVSTLLAPFMTPLLVSFLASGASIEISPLPMFLSIIETVILPVALGFAINYRFDGNPTYEQIRSWMPGVAVVGLACVVGGVTSSQGSTFFTSGLVVFAAVLIHNGVGYLLGYLAGIATHMNVPKRRTLSIEVGMQNAGLATNLATSTAQFAALPQAAVICAVSCVWHSISGTLLAGWFAHRDEKRGIASASELVGHEAAEQAA